MAPSQASQEYQDSLAAMAWMERMAQRVTKDPLAWVDQREGRRDTQEYRERLGRSVP